MGISVLCRAIVTAHGGRIWAENGAQGGTVFRFKLPLATPPPVAPPRSPAVTASPLDLLAEDHGAVVFAVQADDALPYAGPPAHATSSFQLARTARTAA